MTTCVGDCQAMEDAGVREGTFPLGSQGSLHLTYPVGLTYTSVYPDHTPQDSYALYHSHASRHSADLQEIAFHVLRGTCPCILPPGPSARS